MGLFDMMYVCRHCKKAVKMGLTGGCPECGAKPIGYGETGTPTAGQCKMVSDWKKMSLADQNKWVNEVLELDSANPAQSEDVWEYNGCITTTETFSNGEIEEYLGVVSGTDIYLIGGLVGGGLASQEGLIDAALKKAKKSMMGKALTLGANAIVGMSFAITSSGNTNYIIFAATGTAVKVKFNEK